MAFPASEVAEISGIARLVWRKILCHFAGPPSAFDASDVLLDPLPEEITREVRAARKTPVDPDRSDALRIGCGEQQTHRSTFGETEKSRPT
jgi:hypothetical protein